MASCSGGGGDDEVLVLAAASLTEAFRSLDGVASAAGLDPVFSFAGSHVAAEQVRQGAPASLVAVADREVLDGVELAGRPVDFATAEMVAVTHRDSAYAGLRDLADLARRKPRVVIAGPGVPAGRYAREGLRELGLAGPVLDRVVSHEPDVKAVAGKVALGEADVGFVYTTDLRADRRLAVVGEPLPVVATYWAGVPVDAPAPEAARRFLSLLVGETGRAHLLRFGFGVT